MKKALDARRFRYAAWGCEPTTSTSDNAVASQCSDASHLGNSEANSDHWFRHLCRIVFSNSNRQSRSRVSGSDEVYRLFRFFGSVLATATSVGVVTVSSSSNIAFSEADNNQNHSSYSVDARPFTTERNVDIEKVVRQTRERVEEHLKKSCPKGVFLTPFKVAAKGQQVAIRFHVSLSCDLSHLIADLVSRLGLKTDVSGGGSEMILRAWDSAVARQLILLRPHQNATKSGETEQRVEEQQEDPSHKPTEGNNLCVLFFEPLIGSHKAEIEFLKKGPFTAQELDAFTSALIIASGTENSRGSVEKKYNDAQKHRERKNAGPKLSSDAKALEALEAMGVKIYGLETLNGSSDEDVISWDNMAGYHEQKREIEDSVLLALRRPEIYDSIAKGTRRKFESNRPRAVLFEGPPGTGKTSCARVIASQAGVPLLYVPLEVVMSKYYGESERLLGSIFNLANELPDGAIIFLDEVDSLAAARDMEMHEATRRMLSVLLRQIDGFEQEKRVVVIAATNRRQDLDPALISRFDSSIMFGLPDQKTREEIASQYACHLNSQELATLAVVTEGMSGRDLRDVCQQAERHWASKIIRGQLDKSLADGLPPIQEYLACAQKRQETLLKWHEEMQTDDRHSGSNMKKWTSVMV